MTQTTVQTVQCECGEAFGERCQWSGPINQTVLVEYMPESLRSSHEAAGDSGQYPQNGSIRIRVEKTCADRILAYDGDWASIIPL